MCKYDIHGMKSADQLVALHRIWLTFGVSGRDSIEIEYLGTVGFCPCAQINSKGMSKLNTSNDYISQTKLLYNLNTK